MNEFLSQSSVKKSFIAVLVLLAVFLLVQSINAVKENNFIGRSQGSFGTISVSGEGEVTAVPDIATFTFSVTEERESVKEAQDAVSQKISGVLDSLEEMGIDEKDIKTQNYNLYPRYEFFRRQQICPQGFSCPPPSNERVLTGYEISQSISIKLRDLDKVGEMLNSLGNLGVTNINGPSFDVEERAELEKKAREMAIDNARKEAKELAKDLGVKLVRVINFSEGGGGVVFRNFDMAISESAAMEGKFIPEIPVGEDEIKSFVQITYEIR